MKEARVRWIGGGEFVGTDSGNHSVVLSTSQANTGVKPSDMLLVALASCSSVDVVSILEKKKKKLEKLDVKVTAIQDEDPPWTYRKINLKFTLKGEGLTEKDVAKAIELSETKYCSVAATVRGKAEITTEFEILPE